MAGHMVLGEYYHKGMVLSSYHTPDTIEEIKSLQFPDGDIVVNGYPKSGNIY